MQFKMTSADLRKLRLKLRRVRLAALTAIELGDCRAVARLTCEAARLRNVLSLAGTMLMEAA